MKKVLAGVLAVIMAVSLTGCANDGENSFASNLEGSLTEVSLAESSQSRSSGVVNSSLSSDKKTSSTPVIVTDPKDGFDKTTSIKETVLVDENGLKITATTLTFENYTVDLELNLENNGDKNLSITTGTLLYSANAINGYMIDDGYMNCDIAPGKKSIETISFDYDNLKVLGIDKIADIEIGFCVDEGDLNYTYPIPKPVLTSANSSYDYAADTYKQTIQSDTLKAMLDYSLIFSEDKLYDKNGISIVSEALMTNSSGEKILMVEVENSTMDIFKVSVLNISLNGLEVQNGTWSNDTVGKGKRAVIGIELDNVVEEDYVDILGLKEIGSIGFELKISKDDEEIDKTDINVPFDGNVSYDASGDEVYNQNGIKAVYKGMVQDSSDYSNDIIILFLVENKSDKMVRADIKDGTLSMNGYMIDETCWGETIGINKVALLEVTANDSSLEKCKITGIDDVTSAEITLNFKDDRYKDIGSQIVTLK